TATSPINENGTTTLSGTFSDPEAPDTHTVVITWGPGEGSTTLSLGAGVSSFTATHQYLDDNPTGTASDAYPIAVTVADNHGASGAASTTITVNNVAPVVTSLTPDSSVNENGTYVLSGTFHDDGTQDTHTIVINWGAGEGTTTVTAASANPAGTTL